MWYYPVDKKERKEHQHKSTHKIGAQKPEITYTTAKNSNNFAVCGHFRRKKYYGNKREQSTEKINEIGNKVYIIIKHNGF
jgi:hypothetical protein